MTRDSTPTGDRRVRRTHAALQGTLIRLVEERDLGHLSVTNLAEHAGLYRSLLGPQGSARVIDHLRRRTTTAVHIAVRRAAGDIPRDITPSADTPHDVPAAFTAGALVGVAIDWLQHGCPRTPAEMATLTWPLLTAGTPTSEA